MMIRTRGAGASEPQEVTVDQPSVVRIGPSAWPKRALAPPSDTAPALSLGATLQATIVVQNAPSGGP